MRTLAEIAEMLAACDAEMLPRPTRLRISHSDAVALTEDLSIPREWAHERPLQTGDRCMGILIEVVDD